jgi:hypothetical protein
MSRPRLKVVAKAGPVAILGPADPLPLSAFPHDPAQRGYHIVYRDGETNHCPGCGRVHWWIGRLTAECAFCATALPLADPGTWGAGIIRCRRSPLPPELRS